MPSTRPSPRPRLLLLVAAVSLLFTLAPTPASAASRCARELVNDYWADNRVDKTYPISCYREAMESFPPDVQQYSDAEDDLRRALLAAIREQRDSGTATWEEPGEDEPVPAAATDDGDASGGFFTEVLEKLGPKNADSIPVPLLVLGSLALILMGAAGVSYATRYYQAHRAQPAPPADPLP